MKRTYECIRPIFPRTYMHLYTYLHSYIQYTHTIHTCIHTYIHTYSDIANLFSSESIHQASQTIKDNWYWFLIGGILGFGLLLLLWWLTYREEKKIDQTTAQTKKTMRQLRRNMDGK